uniref:Uncharacterized protein n=1 Tax=Glossina palpalis gambiensis TaxID=67801 RepID=A0A1B0B1G6_9MUSC
MNIIAAVALSLLLLLFFTAYLCAISLANNLHLMLKFAYNQYLLLFGGKERLQGGLVVEFRAAGGLILTLSNYYHSPDTV